MLATVCHWRWPQRAQLCSPLLLPWQDCACPSEHMVFQAYICNTFEHRAFQLMTLRAHQDHTNFR
uniref:Uncharacterized protein MANES_09G000200 n=1 Tax=Rhizophora mucronata TaxID=61149 RepID=A0A2P2J8U2_RHIMU